MFGIITHSFFLVCVCTVFSVWVRDHKYLETTHLKVKNKVCDFHLGLNIFHHKKKGDIVLRVCKSLIFNLIEYSWYFICAPAFNVLT